MRTTRDPLTGLERKHSRFLDWLMPPDSCREEKPIRWWEWLIAYACFGVILAINWVIERFER